MPAITQDDAREAYATARRVYSQQLTERQGVDHLVTARGMNRASASDYVRNFRQMVFGRPYHRTLNAFSTELYLRGIRADYDDKIAWNALNAVRAHVVYYEGVSGARSPGIIRICDEFERELGAVTLAESQKAFDAAVQASEMLTPADRGSALGKWPAKPKSRSVSADVFDRNPHVVAAVLLRAAGKCESCGAPAPFTRRAHGTPYLEVHHRIQLAHGGDDTIENATAVCPNCHRHAHFG